MAFWVNKRNYIIVAVSSKRWWFFPVALYPVSNQGYKKRFFSQIVSRLAFIGDLIDSGAICEKEEFDGKEDLKNVLE
jgi:hypothetical protein